MRLGCDKDKERRRKRFQCFNEAEANAPRMQSRHDYLSRFSVASMRPRRMRLGCEYRSGEGHRKRSVLQ